MLGFISMIASKGGKQEAPPQPNYTLIVIALIAAIGIIYFIKEKQQ